jgi:hypothetical protein
LELAIRAPHLVSSKEDHQVYRKWRAETGFAELIQPSLKGSESHYYIKADDWLELERPLW